MNDCILIYSGGIDSSVLLGHLLKRLGRMPLAITYRYGQRHEKEISAANNIIEWYLGHFFEVRHQIIDLREIFTNMISNSALLNKSIDLPKEHYTHENQQVTVVPNRNMIFLSIAIGIAESLGLSRVYYAAHSNDRTIYPDCRPEFIEAIDDASYLGTYNKIRIFAPFKSLSKAEVVKHGSDIGVPLEKTWSCYEGKEYHCGTCATCQERKEAFRLSKIEDRTRYFQESLD